MALPKRKHSRQRGRKRRTHYKMVKPTVARCSQCSEPKLPHRVCGACGYYNGKEIFEVEEEQV